jgi:hypothetical protein
MRQWEFQERYCSTTMSTLSTLSNRVRLMGIYTCPPHLSAEEYMLKIESLGNAIRVLPEFEKNVTKYEVVSAGKLNLFNFFALIFLCLNNLVLLRATLRCSHQAHRATDHRAWHYGCRYSRSQGEEVRSTIFCFTDTKSIARLKPRWPRYSYMFKLPHADNSSTTR